MSATFAVGDIVTTEWGLGRVVGTARGVSVELDERVGEAPVRINLQYATPGFRRLLALNPPQDTL